MEIIILTILFGVFEGLCGKYIHVVDQNKTWSDAQEACRICYTDLAMVASRGDNKLLLAAGPSGWIGLHRDSQNSTLWKWSGGEEMRYQNWSQGQPNNLDGEQNAVVIKSDKGWNDFWEDKLLSFFCIHLLVVETPMPWEKAMKHCKTNDFLGLTWDKLTLAAGEMDRKNVVQGWIGLRFLGDQWQWVSGRQLESETREKLQECPGQNRCAALYSDGLLQSTDCAQELPFICE
ncbi:unnamed protein product [Knipowitschia caucasica]